MNYYIKDEILFSTNTPFGDLSYIEITEEEYKLKLEEARKNREAEELEEEIEDVLFEY